MFNTFCQAAVFHWLPVILNAKLTPSVMCNVHLSFMVGYLSLNFSGLVRKFRSLPMSFSCMCAGVVQAGTCKFHRG